MPILKKLGNIVSRYRQDSLFEETTGRGLFQSDKLQRLKPKPRHRNTPRINRDWYHSNGFIEAIVDAPAEDATREWITITVNTDKKEDEDLNIARLIENRLTELNFQQKLKDLIRYQRIYSQGGFMFLGIEANAPQTDQMLSNPITDVRRLDYINVLEPDFAQVQQVLEIDPTKKDFGQPDHFTIGGKTVHPDRVIWLVRKYSIKDRIGLSVVESILEGATTQATALWSTHSILFELAVKVFKTPQVKGLPPDKIAKLMSDMMAVMGTQSAIAIADDESFDKQVFQAPGMREVLDFVFENLSGLSQMPKSRMMGQAQGIVAAGQFDLLSYHDMIAKFQENDIRPIIKRVIDLIIREGQGKIFAALGGKIESLDWDFTFNPLWKFDLVTQADIDLKQATTDQIYVTIGVLSPEEVRKERFEHLESFESALPDFNMEPPTTPNTTEPNNSLIPNDPRDLGNGTGNQIPQTTGKSV